ncbi:3-deoxy-8-phosphooctulonate synthase [SAR202 cluster bacterium AD-802-F09_MRT_200m]|nr:3-deoxy-8-phosphooctulonate synthase [SAR202 cluster bacterium AD-802-F09_MRT_200m]
MERPAEVGSLRIGDGSLALIAGPCAMESEELCLSVAEQLAGLCAQLGMPYIFKSSFDKANRTALSSFRGHGLDQGLEILRKVKDRIGVPVLTDVHETDQVQSVAEVVDVIQIPAFLSRQTDLLVASGRWGKAVNIKKGQFLPPEDMGYAAEKVSSSGSKNVFLTERGVSFGYRDLMVDMRGLVIMRSLGYPVVFDATHSVQQMGGRGGSSGGKTEFIPAQVRGAVAVGVDALFVETHPEPEHALSDGSTMVPLARMRELLEMALAVHSATAARQG